MTEPTTTPRRWTAAVHRVELPNGLTVLIERNESAPVVASVAHVRAGYFDEPDEWVGISHVLEHMYFKGTATRGPGELARETQLVGGYVNAGTIYDKTIYYTVLPAEPGALERVVDLQSDALMHSRLDPDELAAELEVIVQEAKRKLDTPAAVTVETLYELLFASHRMRRWRIGTEEGLRRLTVAEVRRYYESRYVPSRTIVAVVGPVDVEETVDLVSARYGVWPDRREDIPGSPPETSPPPPARRVIRGDVQRPQVALGWRTVDALHDDAVALDVASQLLGTGRGSWFHRTLRQPGLASSVRAHHYTPGDVGVFDIALEGPVGRLDDAVSVALGAVARLAETGPTTDDMVRVKSLMTTQWARRMETMDGRAAMFCEFEALDGLARLETMYERLVQTESDDVRRVAAGYLAPAAAAGVMFLGPDDAPRTSAGPWPPAASVPDIAPVVVRTPVGPDRGEPVPGRAVGPVTHVAHPGADVLVRDKRGSGLVTLSLLAPRLRERETDATAGVSTLLLRSALRGAAGLDAEQMAEAAERLGGSISPVMLAGGVGWSMTARSDATREAAALLQLIASDATLADDAIERERELQVSDARRAEDDMFNYPIRRVLELAFPGSAHGLPTLGRPAELADLPPAAVREWSEAFRQRRVAVVAVGDADPSELCRALDGFGSWSGREPWTCDERSLSLVPARAHQDRDKAQSALAMAFPAPPRGSGERYAMLVLGAFLGGMAGRLFEELRERRALAYTVSAMPWQRRDAGCFLTYIATSPEREEEAREAMLVELAAVATSPWDRDELDRARRYVAGSFQIRLQRAGSVAAEIHEGWAFGDLDEAEETVARLHAVTEREVRDVAEKVFGASCAEFVLRGTGAAVR